MEAIWEGGGGRKGYPPSSSPAPQKYPRGDIWKNNFGIMEIAAEDLTHYGVKWGVRKDRKTSENTKTYKRESAQKYS